MTTRYADGSRFTGEVHVDEKGQRIGYSKGEVFLHDTIRIIASEGIDDRIDNPFKSDLLQHGTTLQELIRKHLSAPFQDEAFSVLAFCIGEAFGVGTASQSDDKTRDDLKRHLAKARDKRKFAFKGAIADVMRQELERGTPRDRLNAVIQAVLKERGLVPSKRTIEKATRKHFDSEGL